jgi:phosphatidate cytidylyltransferase
MMAEWLTADPVLLSAIGGLFAFLAVASVVAMLFKKLRPGTDLTEVMLRIRSWWIMVILFSAALVSGSVVSIILFALVSFLALKEYLSLSSKSGKPIVAFCSGYIWQSRFSIGGYALGGMGCSSCSSLSACFS